MLEATLIVRVPPNCTQFTVSVPVGTPVSRAIEVKGDLHFGYAPSATGGVQVTTVEAGSVAEAAGVKEGEQIVSVGGQPITTVDACAQMLAQGAGGSIILQLSSWKPVIQVFS